MGSEDDTFNRLRRWDFERLDKEWCAFVGSEEYLGHHDTIANVFKNFANHGWTWQEYQKEYQRVLFGIFND